MFYPDINRIHAVNAVVARGVIRMAQQQGFDREVMLRGLDDDELYQYIMSKMYDPKAHMALAEEEVARFSAMLGLGESQP
jgi:malate dehydrogenase (oxaloacetate-decarboxylating)(NADP+)